MRLVLVTVRVVVLALIAWSAAASSAAALAPPQDGRLSAGSGHTCAIKTDGTPVCWGSGPGAAVPADIGPVIQIAAGDDFTCALRPDHTVKCWGGNRNGQVSDVTTFGRVRQISAGNQQVCAVRLDGNARCVGRDGQGPLDDGVGTVTRVNADWTRRCAVRTDGGPICWGARGTSTVPDANVGTITQIVGGDQHACAIRTDGTPYCWGSNFAGQAAVPPGIGTVTKIAAASAHTCAVKTDGTPVCWGQIAAIPDGIGPVVDITTGFEHVCVIKANGTVLCWGADWGGQSSVPADLGTVTAPQVSAGDMHTCAVRPDGTAACWGDNGSGQTTVPAELGPVSQISAGGAHSCAVKVDGTPVCWGSDTSGQRTIPSGVGTVTRISAGSTFTCAMRSNGTPTCWGSNLFGRAPADPALGTVTQISAGYLHTCVLLTSGVPKCFGANSSGQSPADLGVGTAHEVTVGGRSTCVVTTGGAARCVGEAPADPGIVGAVIAIDGGFTHWCAIKDDSLATCFGDNTDGQGAADPGVGTVLQVSAGTTHSCAVTTAGIVRCWGSNGAGRSQATISGTPPQWLGAEPFSFPMTGAPQRGFAVTGGALPTGLGITNGGVITGIPSEEGTFTATITVSKDSFPPSASTDVTMKVDLHAPTTTDSAPSWVQTAPVTVTLSAADTGGSGVKTTTYEIVSAGDVAGPTKLYSTAAKPVLQAGERIRYRSTDVAGNVEPDQTSAVLKTDAAAPATTDDVPSSFRPGPVTVTLTAADTGGSGVKSTTYEIVDAGGNPGPTTTYDPANKPVLSDGESIRYRSTDNAGNVEATKTSAAAKVDATVPTPMITSAPARSSSERSPVVAFISDGVGATYECSVDDAAFTACASPLTLGPLTDGDHTFRVRATSRAGVTGPVATVAFTIARPVVTPGASAPPKPTLQLLSGAKSRQILLNKKAITVRVSCGQVACTLKIATILRVKGKTRVTLKPITVTLAAGQTQTLKIATTETQRRTIRKLVGKRGTGGDAIFTLTATGSDGTTSKSTVKIGLRRLVNQ